MTTSGDLIDTSFVPVAAPHVSAALFDDAAVLYDADTARPVLLNVSAAAVWSAIDGVRTVADIVALLAVRFGADAAAIEADVSATVVRLRDLCLLTIIGEA